MALSELPPWLNVQPWANPSDVLSQASAAAARRAATELAQRELAQRGQQFQETLNQRNMELAQRQALAQLEQAGVERQMAIREGQLGLEQQKQSAEAEEAAIRFQGMQGLQADLAAGVPYTEAYLRHLPKIAFGSPQTIASAGGREESNAINALRQRDLSAYQQGTLENRLQVEGMRGDTALEKQRMANENRLDVEQARTEAALQKSLPQAAFRELLNAMSAIRQDMILDTDQKLARMRQIRESYENEMGAKPKSISPSGYVVGKTYKGPNNTKMLYLGGDAKLETSWETVTE